MADVGTLWLKLAQMYGAKALEAKFGAVPPDEWRRDIDRLKDYEVDRGITRLKARGEAHIPVLPQFMRLCREVASDADPHQQQQAQQPDGRVFARWVVTANRHLLAHIAGRDVSLNLLTRDPDLMQILIDAKNGWAEQMREWERDGELPADHGRELWDEMMRGAEHSIDLIAARGRAA